MDTFAAAAKFACVSVSAVVAAVMTALELGVAVDLVVTGWATSSNWAVGVVYIAAVCFVVFRVASRRVLLDRAVLELLAVDAVGLPVALAAVSM